MVAISRIALALFAATAYAAVADPKDCTTSTTTTSECTTSTSTKGGWGSTTKPSTPTQTPWGDDDTDVCGDGMELNCCNRKVSTESADVGPHNSGLLSGLINGLGGGNGASILGDCSPIDVASLIGGGAALNGQTCNGRVACCNRSQSVALGGLVNLALPCIALDGVVN